MAIKILPDHIASQIAAGEVVERPASVVKELVENSIDAGSSHISIFINGSGQDKIEVSDNGSGIVSSDLPLAISRHATSKLYSSEDLFNIRTLGFRGEALASIGSVSHLNITSCVGEENLGWQMTLDGGFARDPKPVGAARGTVIKVESLFYNVPARLKFLKSEITERKHITNFIMRYALAYPQIRWEYYQDGNLIFQTSGNGKKEEILSEIFGVELTKKLLPVEYQNGNLSIMGFISPISITRSNRQDIIFFVNGRLVQDTFLTSAVIKAYRTLLMVGRYPLVVLFLNMPFSEVDVNVHPSKAEVRFRNSETVFTEVQRSIKRALLAYSPVPNMNVSVLWGNYSQKLDPAWEMASSYVNHDTEKTSVIGSEAISQNMLPVQHLPLLRLIGQVAATYLIAEGPDGLYLIDQHAAHERVLFEQLMTQYYSSNVSSQNLLDPPVVQVSLEKLGTLDNQIKHLNKLGFHIDSFGPGQFKVRAIPSILSQGNPDQAILSLIETFEEDESTLSLDIEARIAARVCKRMAIKAGQILSIEEQKALLTDLESCQSPRTCPHGRPTMIHLSVDLLERQFGRTGSR